MFFFIFQCTEYDFDYGTECLHLAQKYADTNALLIDGPEFLWKVISFTSGAKTAINTNHDKNHTLQPQRVVGILSLLNVSLLNQILRP